MKILGVDLGSYSVKIAELDVSSKGYAFTAFHEFPLSQDPSRDRSLEIIEVLRQFSSRFDASNTKWVVGVQQNRVSLHHKRFPFRERQKILRSLAFELEDEIPLDIDETIFDIRVSEYVGPFTDVLTIAVPKDTVAETISRATDGGFEADIVSVEGLALANLFSNWDEAPPELPAQAVASLAEEGAAVAGQPPQKARVVLHLGHSRSNLLIFRGDSLVAARNILWGGSEIISALSSALGVPVFEAVKTLQTKSFILMNSAGATKDQVLLSRTISTAVDTLLREVRLSLLEMRAAFNLDYERIDLAGGVAQIQNLGAYLTQGLEIPTNVAHPLAALRQSKVEATAHVESVSLVAIGLALEGLRRPRNPAVNLRKEEFARENETFKRLWQTWKIPAQAALAAFAVFFVFAIVRDSMSVTLVEKADERVAEVAKSVAGLKGASASENGVRGYISRQNKLVKDREALSKAESWNSAFDILARVSEKLPVVKTADIAQGLNVSRFNVDNDDVVIEGRTGANQGAAVIQKILTEFAQPNTLKTQQPVNVPPGSGAPFSFRFKVARTP